MPPIAPKRIAPTRGDAPEEIESVPFEQFQAETETPEVEDFGDIESVPFQEEKRATAGEAVQAFAERGTGAAIQGGTTLAGAIMGGKLGVVAGGGTPAEAITIPLGIIIGGVSGYMAGDTIVEQAEQAGLPVTSSVEDVPEEVRPFAAAGEVVGGSVPFAGAPIIAASRGFRLPASWAGNHLNRILDHAGHNPGAFTAIEFGAASSAATAAGLAEGAFPNRPGIRFGAEVTGGLLSPQRILSGFVQRAGRGIRNTVLRMTPAGRQTRAGELLRDALDAAGEDPEAMLKIIREADIPGVVTPNMSAAQITKSRALIGFEADLKSVNPKFLTTTEHMAVDAMDETARAIRLLEGTGDPQALRQAAILKSEQFKLMMETRLNIAETRMQRLAERITQDTPKARSELSRQAREVLDGSLDRARAVERELWAEIPENTPLPASGANLTLQRHAQVRGEMLADDTLPSLLEKTVTRLRTARRTLQAFERGRPVDNRTLQQAQEQLSLGNLIKVRREFLSKAREAEVKGEFPEARQYGTIAQAVLDDLEAANLGGPGTAYDTARRYSRELNDVFIRTFVGKTGQLTQQGTQAIPPELVLRRAMAAGEELGALQMEQLEVATRFLSDRGLGSALDMESYQTMMQAQERVLRLAAAQNVIRDPATMEVTGLNARGLRRFITKNEELLERFPQVKETLEEAITSEEGRKRLQGQVTGLTKFLENKSLIADALGSESPADAIRGALKSRRPVASLRQLVGLAKQSGEGAQAGLRVAMFEDAFRSAQDTGGKLSMTHLVSAIDDPMRPGLPSMRQFMLNEGVITQQEFDTLGRLTERIRNIQTAQAGRPAGTPPIEETDTLIDTMLRVVGSRLGSLFAGGQTGPQLIASARGSAAFRRLLGRVPALHVQQLLIDAVSGAPLRPGGPRFSLLESLLDGPVSPREEELLVRQVHAYAIQAGLFYSTGQKIEGERQ